MTEVLEPQCGEIVVNSVENSESGSTRNANHNNRDGLQRLVGQACLVPAGQAQNANHHQRRSCAQAWRLLALCLPCACLVRLACK